MKYTYIDTTTNEEFEFDGQWSEFESLLKKNKKIHQTFPNLNYAYRILPLKVSEDYKWKLKQIRKNNPGSTVEIPGS